MTSREGRVLLSREPRPPRGAHASAAGARADRRRRRRRLGGGAPQAPVDQVGDARRDRRSRSSTSRASTCSAFIAARSTTRGSRCGSATASHSCANATEQLRPDRARPHRSGRPVGRAVHAGFLPRLRRAADAGRRDDAAHREPDRASGPHPRRRSPALRAAFPLVTPYLTSIPLYGGMWMMACCIGTLDPRKLTAHEVDRRIAQRGIGDLQYYNGDDAPRRARAAQLRPRADRYALTRSRRPPSRGCAIPLTRSPGARRQTRLAWKRRSCCRRAAASEVASSGLASGHGWRYGA